MSSNIYKRLLTIDLPSKQSAFLWGARKTGKSTYLKTHFPNAVYYDLLKSDIFLRYSKSPHLFREEVMALTSEQLSQPIIVDEVQKIPKLLDEIHWLIENTEAHFILCGSSARKLRNKSVNLLGGRAWSYHFYPLTSTEITDFNLLKIFNNGTIPSHYTSKNVHKSLRAYIQDYLTQEIQYEGLVRNLPSFARFLDSIGYAHGEMTNYNNISRECGVDAKTVKEYYQILIDTLLGYYLFPYAKRIKRDVISSTPKFYLFDVGVANALARRQVTDLRGEGAGRSLEQFIYLEIVSFQGLNDIDYPITYWRTKSGLEVDFIIGNADIAIEVKISSQIRKKDLKGLIAFTEEHAPKQLYVVSLEPKPRKVVHNNFEINILNVSEFLKKLWNGEILEI